MSPGAFYERKRLPVVIVLEAATSSLGSCESTDDGLLVSRLYGDASVPCVWIGGPDFGVEIAWPSSTDIGFEPVRVTGPGFDAVEGDWFRMTGGTRPDVATTLGCPVGESGAVGWLPGAIEFFGDEEPADPTMG